jgi:hypothetical protein
MLSIFYVSRRLFVRREDSALDNAHNGKAGGGEDGEEESNFKFGFEHDLTSYLARASTSMSFAQRNPTVISCRHGFAWKRFEGRAFFFVSRHDPPRMTF